MKVKEAVTLEIGGELVKDSLLESFGNKRDRLVVVYFSQIEIGFLLEGISES